MKSQIHRSALAAGLFALWLTAPLPAQADPCRITLSDAFIGVDAAGTPSGMGLQARIKTYATDGYLSSLGGKPIHGVRVTFEAIFPDDDTIWYLGTGTSKANGWATWSVLNAFGKDTEGFYLRVGQPGAQVKHRLENSQFIQVLAWPDQPIDQCDGEEAFGDVYGSLYFRHPSDTSPILFSDFDDTLFDSSDVVDIITIILKGHYRLIDDYVVDATRAFRDAGGVFIGITAQFSSLRPFTRSELLRWDFDTPYADLEYYYTDQGFDESYRVRTLAYLANDEYPGMGNGADYNKDHCEFKTEKLGSLVNGVFGGHWEDVVGLIGDTESSDGCAAKATGIHWYALMEEGTSVQDTSDPDSYTEILGGWEEALPILCEDADIPCGW